ncbi:MAG: hypothetical protein V5A59_08060 [Bacteroidales bacterium]|nr:hypothetical protein [Bacteroidales bacterium]MBS3774413.1 hypothetical protein [Bacteroidales bacterium]
MIGNKGYRKYLKVKKDSMQINTAKVKEKKRYDGKWVLTRSLDMASEEVALKYKELWRMVEHIFCDVKSILESRPIFHKVDETIRGHVFCSFLALVLKKELERRLEANGQNLEWFQVKQDPKSVKEITIEESSSRIKLRTQARGSCHAIF